MLKLMWVKICANTSLEDVRQAVEAGADAVGFVFARSPRQVGAELVREMIRQLPAAVERVGVFAGGDPAEVAKTATAAGLSAVQMHGGLDLEWAARLRKQLGPGFPLIHTVTWPVGGDEAAEQTVQRQLRQLAAAGRGERVLIDAKVGQVSGGLGQRFDWQRARHILEEACGELQVIVAGGLRPENVAEAISVLSPYGVDVASGVELAPGRKDPERVRQFIENARRA